MWFSSKVRYTKQQDNGVFKRVTEEYLVAGHTFTDVEEKIYKELGTLIKGEFKVTGIKPVNVHDIFTYDDADVYYKVKIAYNAESEEGEKSRRVAQEFLVMAHNVKEAYERTQESLSTMMVDFTIESISISPIIDIFPFTSEEAKNAKIAEEDQEMIEEDVEA